MRCFFLKTPTTDKYRLRLLTTVKAVYSPINWHWALSV